MLMIKVAAALLLLLGSGLIFKALVEMELPSLGVPEAYGGAGADLVTQAIAAEELARADASVSLMLLISKLGMLPVMNFGSEAMKQKYLPRVASGAMPQAELDREALEWARGRGSRSGRVAWQFIQDLAGRLGRPL